MRILLVGASGEVGRSLWAACEARGHSVLPVTSRTGHLAPKGFLELGEALVNLGQADAVVNAGGPGDHRSGHREVETLSAQISATAAAAGVPAVLISTLRVLEGAGGCMGDNHEPSPRTPYAEANARNEAAWLQGETAMVLRMANFFCAPSAARSPQAPLLPWSLVAEGWVSGHIAVRSNSLTRKEFVDSADVVRALELMVAQRPFGQSIATVPGLSTTMRDLVDISVAAIADAGGTCSSTFGEGLPLSPDVIPGWLEKSGWTSQLTLQHMQSVIREWLVEWGPQLMSTNESR